MFLMTTFIIDTKYNNGNGEGIYFGAILIDVIVFYFVAVLLGLGF